jgi:ParB family chromosome partitioning protein
VLAKLQQEAERHRLALKRAELMQTRLGFLLAAVQDLWRQPGFAAVCEAERLVDMPRVVRDRMQGPADDH